MRESYYLFLDTGKDNFQAAIKNIESGNTEKYKSLTVIRKNDTHYTKFGKTLAMKVNDKDIKGILSLNPTKNILAIKLDKIGIEKINTSILRDDTNYSGKKEIRSMISLNEIDYSGTRIYGRDADLEIQAPEKKYFTILGYEKRTFKATVNKYEKEGIPTGLMSQNVLFFKSENIDTLLEEQEVYKGNIVLELTEEELEETDAFFLEDDKKPNTLEARVVSNRMKIPHGKFYKF